MTYTLDVRALTNSISDRALEQLFRILLDNCDKGSFARKALAASDSIGRFHRLEGSVEVVCLVRDHA